MLVYPVLTKVAYGAAFSAGLVLCVQDGVNERARRLAGSDAEHRPCIIHAEEEQGDRYDSW